MYFKRGADFTYSQNNLTASPEFVAVFQNEPKCEDNQAVFCLYLCMNIVWLYKVTCSTLLSSLSNTIIRNYV